MKTRPRLPSASLPSITVKWHISGLKHTLTTPWYGQYPSMPTTISPRQWQPWTAVLPLLGLISMAAVGSKTLYCRGECKSAILAYRAGIRRERDGDFFFSPKYPLPFMHLPSKLYPMKRESGFWNAENFCLWDPKSGFLVKSEILGFRVRNTA